MYSAAMGTEVGHLDGDVCQNHLAKAGFQNESHQLRPADHHRHLHLCSRRVRRDDREGICPWHGRTRRPRVKYKI